MLPLLTPLPPPLLLVTKALAMVCGTLTMMLAKMMSEMPLPMPFSVINWPSQTRNIEQAEELVQASVRVRVDRLRDLRRVDARHRDIRDDAEDQQHPQREENLVAQVRHRPDAAQACHYHVRIGLRVVAHRGRRAGRS